MKYLFRNIYSGATFVVIGDRAAAYMKALASWRQEGQAWKA